MQSQVGLGSITTNKAGGGDGIPVELYQVLKDDAVTMELEFLRQKQSSIECGWLLVRFTLGIQFNVVLPLACPLLLHEA